MEGKTGLPVYEFGDYRPAFEWKTKKETYVENREFALRMSVKDPPRRPQPVVSSQWAVSYNRGAVHANMGASTLSQRSGTTWSIPRTVPAPPRSPGMTMRRDRSLRGGGPGATVTTSMAGMKPQQVFF